MTLRPQTIQIFLPGGAPTGIRVAEITTRIVQVIEVPRKLLPDFFKMAESEQVGVYYLVSKPDDDSQPEVYVGQTGDLRGRLAKHDSDKDFWERALVLISRTQSITQTHALYLEWLSIQAATKAQRYETKNGNAGSRPYTPAPMEADCLEIFETGQTLLTTLGYPLFDAVAPQAGQKDQALEFFYCTAGGANAKDIYTTEGFVVLEGSIGRKNNVPSIMGTSDAAFRDKLLASDLVKIEGESIVFLKDHLFPSPSRAAMAVLGRTANGWQEWKDSNGTTLDLLKRQAISSASA